MAHLVIGLIRFLDAQEFTADELLDIEYISNQISTWVDYEGEEYSDEDSVSLAQQYSNYKLNIN